MAENDNVFWGIHSKEQRLKDFVEHQDREATRTREATEALAQEAVIQSAIQAEAMGRVIAAQKALQSEAELRRAMPELLFQVNQIKPTVLATIEKVLTIIRNIAPSAEISPEYFPQLQLASGKIREFTNAVYSIDSAYLNDFSQKKALKDLLEQLNPIVKQWNSEGIQNKSLRRILTPNIVAKRYATAMKFTKAQINHYLSTFQQAVAKQQIANRLVKSQISILSGGFWASFCLFLPWVFIVLQSGFVLKEDDSNLLHFLVLIFGIPIIGGYAGVFYWNTCHNPSEDQETVAALSRELATIHPSEDITSLEIVQNEMIWKGDAWVLNPKGKEAIEQEIDKLWQIEVPA